MSGRKPRDPASRDLPAAAEVSGRVFPPHVRGLAEALRRVARRPETAVLTWQDAVSNSSSSASTTFTVVEDPAFAP